MWKRGLPPLAPPLHPFSQGLSNLLILHSASPFFLQKQAIALDAKLRQLPVAFFGKNFNPCEIPLRKLTIRPRLVKTFFVSA